MARVVHGNPADGVGREEVVVEMHQKRAEIIAFVLSWVMELISM